jgi:cytochrome c oxidase subunit III
MAIHTDVATHGHAANGHEPHEHYWEWSWAPAAISVGALCLTLTFMMYFVYEAKLPAILFAGVGVPLMLAGIANWMGAMGVTGPTDMKLNSLTLSLFITSEVLIFFAMFAGYYMLRIEVGAADEPWPPAGTPEMNHVLPLIMTALLVIACFTYHHAEKAFEEGGFIFWLLLTIVLGAVFLGGTAYEYNHLWTEGFKPGTNQYGTAFYALTGFHAAHILVGLLAFVIIFFGSVFGKVHPSFVKLAGVYWYFVTLLSFLVVTQVYFW